MDSTARAHDAALTQEQLERLLADPDRIDVHFQPVTGFDTRAICGAEALLRATLDGVPVAAPALVAAAVEAGRMREIGRHVLARAISACELWRAAGYGSITILVNLDGSELVDPDLATSTASMLAGHGIDPGLLVLELTETAFIADVPVVRENLAALRALGVGLALDDFGAGYASLSYLRSVPLTMVKLDRQFVATVETPGTDHEIVRNVVRLGHALGLRVVAEGVEVTEQRTALEALGCDAWQGFLRSPAVGPVEFIRELRADARAAAAEPAARRPSSPSASELDSFVLRRIGGTRWAHLGGANRGEGWAGIVDVDETSSPVLSTALRERAVRIESSEQRWLLGPYHPRAAILLAIDPDTVVIFGSTVHRSLPGLTDDDWTGHALELARTTTAVSPAKRLADELEVSEALQHLISNSADTLDEAMRHVVGSAAEALSCEFGVLYLSTEDRIAFDDHTIHNVDPDELRIALGRLAESIDGPICVQDAESEPLPLPLPSDFGVRSWLALPTAPTFGGVLVCAHTDRNPRGFTTLCQRLGRKLADASELVLHAGAERQRLATAAVCATAQARIDALTGVFNRRGWDDALAACSVERDGPVSVVIADIDDLKMVNDTHGHAAGDRVLIAAARCLRSLVSEDDVVARIGGDEFAVLMRGADAGACRRVERELHELLRAERIDLPDLGLAAGHATNVGVGSLAETIAIADSRMYEVKAAAKRVAREALAVDRSSVAGI